MKFRIPPPLIFLACATVMWFLPPVYSFPRYLWAITSLLIFASVIGIMSLWQFWRVKTTVDPIALEKASQLVVSGVYRFSRNPMYLSLALLLLAWGLWLGSLSAVIFLIVFLFSITQLQIKPEEKVLEKLFGEEYRSYKQKVRRWI